MVDQKSSFQRRENVWRNLPCNDTLELISTIALLTFLHKAVATVTSIYGLPEVKKNLRNILSIILLSYNAFGLQKLDTEPQTPRGCHQKRFQNFFYLCAWGENFVVVLPSVVWVLGHQEPAVCLDVLWRAVLSFLRVVLRSKSVHQLVNLRPKVENL